MYYAFSKKNGDLTFLCILLPYRSRLHSMTDNICRKWLKITHFNDVHIQFKNDFNQNIKIDT